MIFSSSLLARAGDELWEALKQLQPHLFKATVLMKLHQLREQAVHDFGKHLKVTDWDEGDWQKILRGKYLDIWIRTQLPVFYR